MFKGANTKLGGVLEVSKGGMRRPGKLVVLGRKGVDGATARGGVCVCVLCVILGKELEALGAYLAIICSSGCIAR